jgi:ABC-type Fe3+ transport system permease subunit
VKIVRPVLILLVVLVCLAPAGVMVYDSLRDDEGFSLAAYSGILSDSRQIGLFTRSLFTSALATLLALVWGIPVGYAAARLRGLRGAAIEALSYLPLLLPSIVIVMGWIFILGRAGVVTGVLKAILGLPGPPIDIYSPVGVAFVLSLCYFPCVSILAAQGFRSVDPASIRAARLTAGPFRRLWSVWRPLLAPYLATGALLTFLLSFSDFGVASALTVDVYPIEVFVEISAFYDVKRGIATFMPAVVLAVTLFVIRQAVVRSVPYATLGAAARAEREPVSRPVIALAIVAIVLAAVMPLVFLGVTAGEFGKALRTAGHNVLVSVDVAARGMLLLLFLGAIFAAAYRGLGRRGRSVAEMAALLPLVVPGTAVGLGILRFIKYEVWPISDWSAGAGALAYADAARYVSFAALILAVAVASLRVRLFQAAAVSGAGPVRTAPRGAGPLLWPGIVGAAALSFLFCLGELSAAILVYPAGFDPLTVRIESLLHFSQDQIVAALCLVLAALVLGVLVLGTLLVNRPIRIRIYNVDRTA